jgi:hypothetical protein
LSAKRAERRDSRCGAVCRIPGKSAGDGKPAAMGFLEYMESKIAKKEALDVREDVVKLLCERFHL